MSTSHQPPETPCMPINVPAQACVRNKGGEREQAIATQVLSEQIAYIKAVTTARLIELLRLRA
jgi:hypothetical protein